MSIVTPQGGPAPTAEMKVNPTNLDDVKCDKCGNYTFMKVQLMKRMPALISPTGVEAFMPMDVYSCAACNHVNTRFIKGMGGWFKGANEDEDAEGIPEAHVVIEGSDLPDMDEAPVDEVPVDEEE